MIIGKPLKNYSFLRSFLENCGDKVVFLCGDLSRKFCEEMVYVAESMNRQSRIFEIIKEQQRKRIGEMAERKKMRNILGFLTRSKIMLKFLLLFVRTKVDKAVIESVNNCDAVIWVGLHEDFDVFYLADKRLVDAILNKSFLFLSFPSRSTAEILGINYEDYWKTFFGALNYPWEKIKALGEALREQLLNNNTLNVTSPLGTDFTLNFQKGKIRLFYGIVNEKALGRGKIQLQLPAGELFVEVKEPKVNGKMFFDVPCILEGKVVSGITITVENGNVVNFHAEKGELILRKFFEQKRSRTVREIGFGLNPAIRPCGSIYIDEKAYKTIHIGFGELAMLGHIDLVMSDPTVYVNGKRLTWRI
jgi:hypothetical protein